MNANQSKAKIEREKLLFDLGFTKCEDDPRKWEHKMFEHGRFDFTDKDPDLFWTMDTIFKTCIKAGETIKANTLWNSFVNINGEDEASKLY